MDSLLGGNFNRMSFLFHTLPSQLKQDASHSNCGHYCELNKQLPSSIPQCVENCFSSMAYNGMRPNCQPKRTHTVLEVTG